MSGSHRWLPALSHRRWLPASSQCYGPRKTTFYLRTIQFFDIAAVGDHRRDYRSHQLRTVRIVFSIRSFTLGQHVVIILGHVSVSDEFFIFIRHERCSLCRFSHFVKSKPLQGVHYLPRPVKIQYSGIGRGPIDMIVLYPCSRYPLTRSISLANVFAFCGQTSRQRPQLITVVHHDTGLFIPD